MLYVLSNRIWSILLVTSILGLALELEAKGKPKHDPQNHDPRTQTACFMVGSAPLPSDVHVNPELANSCIKDVPAFPDEPQLKQLPDVEFNGKKFSDISYKKRKAGQSAVRFAMETFPLSMDKKDLDTVTKIYDAINAGLRSINNGNSKRVLGELKGVAFFLGLQLGRKDNNPAVITRNMAKTKKNCVKCSPKDIQDLEALTTSDSTV
ncbi:hypothetical protein DFH28DRAFT_951466 [Melampsora americana]|nr:hypothetical protein DFH28DRAFT_951466 [Melampsora americana]